MRVAVVQGSLLFAIVLSVALPLSIGAQMGKAPSSQAPQGPRALRMDCRRISLSQPPSWTNSGVWEGANLVLVDTVSGRLLRYSAAGDALGGATAAVPKTLAAAFPTRIAAQDGKIVVQVGPSSFLNLGPGLSFQGAVDAGERGRAAGGATIEKLLTWAPAGTDIIGFAEVKEPSDQWSSGVVRFPQQGSGEFRSLGESLSTGSASREFHRLGYHYTAAIGSTGYVLLMEDGFRLYSSPPGSDHLKEMKALGQWSVPELPSFIHPEDYKAVMGVVEESAMPVELYAWGKDLYLLSRRPLGGSTEWRLSRIDVEADRIAETTIIPSRAHHLFAIPGKDQWAFVEKGVARGLREQEAKTALLVPSAFIQHPSAVLCQ